jgi:hypothetical protein
MSPCTRQTRRGILDKDKTMDNVQKRNICTNVQSSQTFRSNNFTVVLVSYEIYSATGNDRYKFVQNRIRDLLMTRTMIYLNGRSVFN